MQPEPYVVELYLPWVGVLERRSAVALAARVEQELTLSPARRACPDDRAGELELGYQTDGREPAEALTARLSDLLDFERWHLARIVCIPAADKALLPF
jgi:hypothetical protein